jgi:hypothetical protein
LLKCMVLQWPTVYQTSVLHSFPLTHSNRSALKLKEANCQRNPIVNLKPFKSPEHNKNNTERKTRASES